jgi:hypothetical protein
MLKQQTFMIRVLPNHLNAEISGQRHGAGCPLWIATALIHVQEGKLMSVHAAPVLKPG